MGPEHSDLIMQKNLGCLSWGSRLWIENARSVCQNKEMFLHAKIFNNLIWGGIIWLQKSCLLAKSDFCISTSWTLVFKEAFVLVGLCCSPKREFFRNDWRQGRFYLCKILIWGKQRGKQMSLYKVTEALCYPFSRVGILIGLKYKSVYCGFACHGSHPPVFSHIGQTQWSARSMF